MAHDQEIVGTAHPRHIWRLWTSDLVGHKDGETFLYLGHGEREEGRGQETRVAEVEYDNLIFSILHEVGGIEVARAKVQMLAGFIAEVDAMGFA